MSDEKELDYDPAVEASSYGTIHTTGLFDREKSSLKISRMGVINIRIPWATIIWGGVFFFIGLGFWFLILVKMLGGGTTAFLFTIFLAGLFGIAGAKLGNWSPMAKSTGEDLLTYFSVILRQKISVGGFSSRKPSETILNSKAVGNEDGRLVKCQLWLGTQPLYDAPPMNPYEYDYMTRLYVPPRGERKVMPTKGYKDGLGDRF